MESLCILLPLTSRGANPDQCIQAVARLGASLLCSARPARSGLSHQEGDGHLCSSAPPALAVCIGLDADDALVQRQEALAAALPIGIPMRTLVFDPAEQATRSARGAPLCWMWDELAAEVRRAFHPAWTLLLGDDVRLVPAGWPALLAEHAAANPHLRCIALLDVSDPGFPSFPAIDSSHLELFGRMVPEEFVNQGGDPFLFELYRAVGAADICRSVSIANACGGVQGSLFAPSGGGRPPRYARAPLPPAKFTRLLEAARARLCATDPVAQRCMQVAVAVPCYRMHVPALRRILEI